MNATGVTTTQLVTVLIVSGLMFLLAACFTTVGEATQSPVSPNAQANVVPTPLPLHELRVFIEPRDCTSFILDPQPVEGSRYAQGTPVTISLVPAEDCRVKEWINVDSFSGLFGKVNMNADRIVQVNLVRVPATPVPIPQVSAETSQATHELEIIADPREAADFLLNPKPNPEGAYDAGTTVTIDVLPKTGWKIGEWVGPVYAVAGKTAKVNVDASQTVIVRFERQAAEASASPISTTTPPQRVSATPTPSPSLRNGAAVQFEDVRVVEILPQLPDQSLAKALESAKADPEATITAAALGVVASRTPTLQDDFSDPSSGFGEREGAGSVNRYENGYYLMATDENSACCLGTNVKGDYTNLVAQLDMRIEPFANRSSISGAFVLRRTTSEGHYSFSLKNSRGEPGYIISARKQEQFVPLRSGPLPAGSDRTVGAWHNMIVVMVDDEVSFFIDGVLVASVKDESITHGGFKMFAQLGTLINIDNFRLWDIAGLDLTTPPTVGNPPNIVAPLQMALSSALSDPNLGFALAALQVAASQSPTIQDDFSDAATGFGEKEGGGSFTRYEGGEYLMATHPDSPCCFGTKLRGDYTDMVAQIDMRLEAFESDSPIFGAVALRRTKGIGFYIFNLTHKAGITSYSIAANKGEEHVPLKRGALPPISETSAGTQHNLIIVMVGNQIAFFIDGVLVEAFTDGDLTRGGFNSYAGWGTEVSLDNFRLWDLG